MVTGLELIPIFQILLQAVDFFMKLIPKKRTSDFQFKLESVKSILKEMKPLIEDMKKGEGTSTMGPGPGPGVPEHLKRLIKTVEEGNQLVREEKYQKLEEWIDSFWISLSTDMWEVRNGMTSKETERRQQLPHNHGSPQIQLHLHFSEEKYKTMFQKLIDCANMFSESESLSQGNESVSTNKTKDAKEVKQSVPSLAVTYTAETSTSKPEENTVTVRKVVFEGLVRDENGKKVVEKAGCEVKGVISAERVLQHNQDRDLVIVIGTENFDEQDMIKYMKKRNYTISSKSM